MASTIYRLFPAARSTAPNRLEPARVLLDRRFVSGARSHFHRRGATSAGIPHLRNKAHHQAFPRSRGEMA